MKNGNRILTFLVLLLLMHIYVHAQYFKPAWVNDIGGTGDSKASNIAPDNNGSIYISGYIRGTVTFNLREGGTKTLASNGNSDNYIAKYDIATGKYIWAISFGGDALDQPNSMAVDSRGNVLITGQFQDVVNFNPAGNFELTSHGSDDIFVAKYSSNGSFIWAFCLGGGDIDRGHYITTDNQDNVLITASYTGLVDVDPSPSGTKYMPDQGSLACFFAKYDANGNFLWAHPLGNVNQQNLTAVAVDKSTNDVVVTGDFSGNVDFSYSGNATATFNSPGISNFVARYNSDGVYKWVDYLPGSGSGIASSLKIDSHSNIIITASFGGNFYPSGPTGTPITAQGSSDAVVASYNSNGALNWAKDLGSNNCSANSRYITVDGNNNLYITGYFTGIINVGTAVNGTLNASGGGNTVFIIGLSSSGAPIAAGAIGGNCNSNIGYEVAAVGSNIYVAGAFCQTADFDTGSCGTDNITAVNNICDSFLASFTVATSETSNITAFNIPQQISPAVINQLNHTISVQVAPGSNITSLTPTITTDNGGTLNPASGATENFSSPVNYTVNASCEPIVYQASVIIYAAKTSTICSGATITLSGDIQNPVPDSYTWQIFQNNSWVNASGTINNKDYQTSSLTNNTPSDVIYQLRRQTITSGVVAYDSFYNITVTGEPITISNNNVTAPPINSFCVSGNPGVITGSAPTGGSGTYTYQWQSSTDNVAFNDISGATTASYTPGAISATTYYRREVTSGACNTPSISNVVAVAVLPAVTNNVITASAITSFCVNGAPGTINGSTPTGGNGTYIYQWQSSTDNATFNDISGATSINYSPSSISATTYFRRTVTSGACITPLISNVVTITILPVLANNAITAPATATFCTSGNPGSITGSTPTGGSGTYSFQWQNSIDNVTFNDILGATNANYSPGLISATTYYRREVTSGACATPLASNVATITIVPNPAVPVPTVPTVSICSGSGAILSVASPMAGLTYNWYDSPAKTNLLTTGTSYTTPSLTNSETVYIEAENGICSSPSMASIQVNVNALPAAPGFVTNPISVCSGSSAILTIANVQTGFTYNWYSAATGGTAITNGTTFASPSLNSATTYYAEAVNTSSGCVSATRSAINVNINPIPDVTPVADGVCPGSTATLSASSTDNNAIFTWYADVTGGSPLFTGSSFTTPALNTTTTYYLEVADNNTACSIPSRTPVIAQILSALPAPVVTVASTTIASVTFQWDAVPGASGYEVSTDNGQTYSAPSSGSNGLTETISNLQEDQSITIIVRATGQLPCQLGTSSTAVTAIATNPASQLIYVPNAFTPNGDGKNDVVYVHSENIKTMRFSIYNQWGQMIFTSTSLQNGWDGTYKGAKEPVGVYVYYLEAVLVNNQKINKKGSITLIR